MVTKISKSAGVSGGNMHKAGTPRWSTMEDWHTEFEGLFFIIFSDDTSEHSLLKHTWFKQWKNGNLGGKWDLLKIYFQVISTKCNNHNRQGSALKDLQSRHYQRLW